MGEKEESETDDQAVEDSDYSGRPLGGITIEALRADHARGGIVYDDALSLVPLRQQDGERIRPPEPEDGDRTRRH